MKPSELKVWAWYTYQVEVHAHDPQIIHRDLTAKNVLLTSSLVAKITDLGNSRIVTLQPGQLARTLSRLPGTLAYMPPEALSSSARYGPSLDIFSFGHLKPLCHPNLSTPTPVENKYMQKLSGKNGSIYLPVLTIFQDIRVNPCFCFCFFYLLLRIRKKLS